MSPRKTPSTETPQVVAPQETTSIGDLSFEQALTQLETIVRELEQGNVDLGSAVGAYERGVALRRHCEARLNEARMTVERISQTPGSPVSLHPFEAG